MAAIVAVVPASTAVTALRLQSGLPQGNHSANAYNSPVFRGLGWWS